MGVGEGPGWGGQGGEPPCTPAPPLTQAALVSAGPRLSEGPALCLGPVRPRQGCCQVLLHKPGLDFPPLERLVAQSVDTQSSALARPRFPLPDRVHAATVGVHHPSATDLLMRWEPHRAGPPTAFEHQGRGRCGWLWARPIGKQPPSGTLELEASPGSQPEAGGGGGRRQQAGCPRQEQPLRLCRVRVGRRRAARHPCRHALPQAGERLARPWAFPGVLGPGGWLGSSQGLGRGRSSPAGTPCSPQEGRGGAGLLFTPTPRGLLRLLVGLSARVAPGALAAAEASRAGVSVW